jgi:hypothetical protein
LPILVGPEVGAKVDSIYPARYHPNSLADQYLRECGDVHVTHEDRN